MKTSERLAAADLTHIVCPCCGRPNDNTYKSHALDCQLAKYNARIALREAIKRGEV